MCRSYKLYINTWIDRACVIEMKAVGFSTQNEKRTKVKNIEKVIKDDVKDRLVMTS